MKNFKLTESRLQRRLKEIEFVLLAPPISLLSYCSYRRDLDWLFDIGFIDIDQWDNLMGQLESSLSPDDRLTIFSSKGV